MKVSLEPAYVPLIQKPHTCAAACMQMILYRNGCGLHDQEEIAIRFGVKVAEGSASAFSDAMPVAQLGETLGLSTVNSASEIEKTLSKFGAKLEVKAVRASQIENLMDFLQVQLNGGNDLWIEYDASHIHSYDSRSGAYIHDGLVEAVDAESGHATLIDSMPDHKQRIMVSIDDLAKAIAPDGKEETGFIVVEQRR